MTSLSYSSVLLVTETYISIRSTVDALTAVSSAYEHVITTVVAVTSAT
jgi:hypothetical protein